MVAEEFRNTLSGIRILIASEALGAGMHCQGVHRVIQKGCSGLTICQLRQRFGRGAWNGGRSVGYLLHEKRLGCGGKLTSTNPGNKDPWLLHLIQDRQCCETIFDLCFMNPQSPLISPPPTCCNRCHAFLTPRSYTWIHETPADTYNDPDDFVYTQEMKEAVQISLVEWRNRSWMNDWKERWVRLGPEDVVADVDLVKIANTAAKIKTLDDLRRCTFIVYWKTLSGTLWDALKAAWETGTGTAFPRCQCTAPSASSTQAPLGAEPPPSYSAEAASQALSVAVNGGPAKRKGKPRPLETLVEGESMFTIFDTT